MKKSYIFALVFVCILILAIQNFNKGYKIPESSYTEQFDYTDEIEEEGIEDTESPTTITTGTVLYHTSSGYTYEMTISVGEWIKGSDAEKLQQQWQYFGEEGDYPTLGDNHSRQIYLMGEISFENKTEGDFPITDIERQWLSLYIDDKNDILGSGEIHGAMMYSSPSYSSQSSLDCVPAFKSDHWGPCTFVFALDNKLGPDRPNGLPEIDDFQLDISNLGGSVEDYSNNFYKIDPDSSVGRVSLPLTKSW